MEKYIEGYYCRNDLELEMLNKGSNRKILEALRDAYPSGLTVKEIAHETRLPEKTVYPQIKNLSREHFIVELGKQKQSIPRGRPTFKESIDTQRPRGQVIIEDASRFFDKYEGKRVYHDRNYPLPPGNVEYYGPFLQLWDELAEKEELEGLTMVVVRFIKKMVTRTIESENGTIVQIRPTTNIKYCCSQCGLNHEARDFIRALSLCLIDEVEKSEPYLYFLREYDFITEEAFKHALAKIPKLTKPSEQSLEFRKTVANLNLKVEDIEGVGPSTAKKLREAGFSLVKDLAVASVVDLAEQIICTKDTAASFIRAAQMLLREKAADAVLKDRMSLIGRKGVYCGECGENFDTVIDLDKHIKTNHKT